MEHRLFSFKTENVYDSAPASHCWDSVLHMKWGLKISGSKPFIKPTYKAEPGTYFQKRALTCRYFRLMQYSMFQPSLANDEENKKKKSFFPKIHQRWFGEVVYLPSFLSPFFLCFLFFSFSTFALSLFHAEASSRPW